MRRRKLTGGCLRRIDEIAGWARRRLLALAEKRRPGMIIAAVCVVSEENHSPEDAMITGAVSTILTIATGGLHNFLRNRGLQRAVETGVVVVAAFESLEDAEAFAEIVDTRRLTFE